MLASSQSVDIIGVEESDSSAATLPANGAYPTMGAMQVSRMHVTHIGFPGSEALELPTVTGFLVTTGKMDKVFIRVDYLKRRRAVTLPYGRQGVTVVFTPYEYKGRPATKVRAYDYRQNACCLPTAFKFWNCYIDGTICHIEAFDAANG